MALGRAGDGIVNILDVITLVEKILIQAADATPCEITKLDAVSSSSRRSRRLWNGSRHRVSSLFKICTFVPVNRTELGYAPERPGHSDLVDHYCKLGLSLEPLFSPPQFIRVRVCECVCVCVFNLSLRGMKVFFFFSHPDC